MNGGMPEGINVETAGTVPGGVKRGSAIENRPGLFFRHDLAHLAIDGEEGARLKAVVEGHRQCLRPSRGCAAKLRVAAFDVDHLETERAQPLKKLPAAESP